MPPPFTVALDPTAILGSLAAIIGLGYLGSWLFDTTRIPDVLLLMGLGVVLGPVTHVLEPAVFEAIAPAVGIFTLLIILFDGGLSLKFRDLFHGLARAGLLAIVGWVLTVTAITVLMAVIYRWPIQAAVLLGAILGGSSAIVIIPLVTKMGAPESTRVTLSVESALTDVLCVVGTLTIIGIIAGGGLDIGVAAGNVLSEFSVAILLGAGAGLAWSFLWHHLERGPYAYMLTLAVILLLHLLVEELQASGPIAVLAFGIMLGNRITLHRGDASRAWEPGGEMRRFQQEVTFFVRAFFFVFLGVLLDLEVIMSVQFLIGSLVILAGMVGARWVAIQAATAREEGLADERPLWLIMMPRGLAAAALASIPAQEGLAARFPQVTEFTGYAFALIVLTNLMVTVGIFLVPTPTDEDE